MSLLMRSYRFPLDSLRREMETLLSDRWPFSTWMGAERAFPPVNIYETPEAVQVEFEVPGVSMDDLDLSITGGSVTLKVKRQIEGDIPPEKYYVRERWRGEFGRNVTVPGRVDSTKASASYRNGILAVTIPKAEEARPKRITVTGEKKEKQSK